MEFFKTQKKITTRKNLHYAEVFYVAVVLLCALSIIATCEPCSVIARDQLNSDACRSFTVDVFSFDVTSGPASQNLVLQSSLDNVCPDSNLFCFRSTLPGVLSQEQDTNSEPEVSGAQSNVTSHARSNEVRANGSWSSSFGTFRFSSGRTISLWKSSVLVRNNLSGVEWLSLRGSGGSLSMVLLEESEPAQILEFKLGLPTPRTQSSPDLLHHEEVGVDACSRTSSKELYAKNTGDLPFEVKRIGVFGSGCWLDGFLVHTCKGFSLEPGDTTKLVMTYQTDFSVDTIQRDLELALAIGIFVIPMKASLTMHMLGFCRKSIFWTRLKKAMIAILLVAIFLILVLCCFLPQAISLGTQDYLLKSRKTSTAGYPGKSSRGHCSQKKTNKIFLSAKMNGFFRSIGEDESLLLESLGRYGDGQTAAEEKNSSAKHVKSSLEFERQTNCLFNNGSEETLSTPSMENSTAVKRCDTQEATQGGNLTVKTGKVKGRRRRKKKSSGAGVSGLFEVSSSQSGNSTPSSPLSPASSFTPKRSPLLSPDVDQPVQVRNLFGRVANQQHERHANSEPKSKANGTQPEIPFKPIDKNKCSWKNSTSVKPAVLQKINGKAILLPSATFPSARRPDPLFSCSPFLASTSPIAPHARAPGSKLFLPAVTSISAKKAYKIGVWISIGNVLA